MNPTPVLAVLPTIKSPPVVSLTLAPGPSSDGGGAPLALNTEDLPTNVRSLDNVKKYSDTPGTFLDEVKRARHVKTTEREPAADWSVLPVQSRWGSAPQSFDTVCSDYFSRGRPDLGLGFGGRSSARRWTFLLHASFNDYSREEESCIRMTLRERRQPDARSKGCNARTLAAPETAPEARCHVADN